MKDVEPAFAIVRIDLDAPGHEERVTVRRVVWSQELAEEEVRRLQTMNRDKRCRYFWQYTRVDQRSTPAS